MSIVMEINPFNFFTDTNGDALDAGYVYIGEANKDPRQYPVAVYYDLENTIPAAQPLRTSNGYIVRNGSPTFLFVQGNYSVMVRDSRGRQIYYVPDFLLIGTNQAVTFNDLSNTDDIGKGDALIGVKQPFSGATAQTQHQKNSQFYTAADAGAVADGVTDDLPALNAMAAALGYIRLSRGNYRVGSGTISVPIFFDPDAYLTVNSGDLLVITNRINTPLQWIFRGAGDYQVNIATPNGEDARDLHVGWFGVFPANRADIDSSPGMQKALNALGGTAREGILRFSQGSYRMKSGVVIPRGVHVMGSGTRRTVFDIVGDGYVPFTSGNVAVKITGIQFEQSDSIFSRDSGYIQISHGTCELYDIWLWAGKNGIIVDGADCTIRNVSATYGVAIQAGSSSILVRASGCTIDGFKQNTSAFGPTAIVEVGSAASNTGFTRITNIQHACPSISVFLNAALFNVTRVNIDNILYAGLAGTSTPYIVKTLTAGATTISNVTISGLNANSLAGCLVGFEQNSSGATEDITVDSSIVDGSTGVGIEFIRTLGNLRRVTIGDTVDVAERTTPYTFSGAMSVSISAMADPAMGVSATYPFTIANDSAVSVDFRRSIFSGSCILTAGSTNYGQFVIRAAPTPAVTPMFTPSANVNTLLSALTGTTGAVGKLTLGVQPSMLYVENRLGTSQAVTLSVNY